MKVPAVKDTGITKSEGRQRKAMMRMTRTQSTPEPRLRVGRSARTGNILSQSSPAWSVSHPSAAMTRPPIAAPMRAIAPRPPASNVPTAPLPASVEMVVYRLVQEALTNTLKHAGAGARAVVRLRFLPGELRLEVDDDGAGRNGSPGPGTGGGLLGMRERARAYGGDVLAGPREPHGWRVSAHLKLESP